MTVRSGILGTMSTPDIIIPASLLPADGRFGCGPSKVRPEAVAALAAVGSTWLGTSHRQRPVLDAVGRLRAGLRDLFSLPDGYEVVLGNGGATAFWDVATFGLIERKSQHCVFGEFSSKFAQAAAEAPHLEDPEIVKSEPGTRPDPVANDAIDVYALTDNETSTGVMMPVIRPRHADGRVAAGLVAVDATSGGGGLLVDPAEFDAYYFSPQKSFASDGGLWIALLSPAAVARVGSIKGSGRWIPASIDLSIALDSSRKDQTYNTPSLATIFLMNEQIGWMLEHGGLPWAAGRCAASARMVYDWADASDYATPFVADPSHRSNVVATIDLDARVDAQVVSKVLRANGIVDTDAYRKLGRNQLRIGLFPAVEPADVEAFTRSVDFVVAALS
jgi:phosphoserine aminotransferase